ncbi:MAG: hypothetical protein Q8P41_23980 [Pseudomonadota bacterium]|nr:hypothetical protein [Pseudomonadota bacterium]
MRRHGAALLLAPLLLAVLLAAAAPVAFAKEGPAAVIPTGTAVRIEGIGRKDAFWRFREELVGQVCAVGEPGLVHQKREFYSGALECPGEESLYFYQVEVEQGDYGAILDELVRALPAAAPALERAEPMGPELEVDAPPAVPSRKADGRLQGAAVPAGQLVRIVDLAPADRYHADRAALIGLTCNVIEGPLVPSGDAWFAGRLFCGDGKDWQLYQVAVAPE